MRTSIILTTYDSTPLMRKITSACIASINKYTDDYELIVVDNKPVEVGFNEREHLVKIDKHVINEENVGCSAGNNQGAALADPESKYICFIQSDVFVSDGWLPKLQRYLEDNDVVLPHQGPIKREEYVKWRDMTFEEVNKEQGNDDGGLILMTMEAWKKTEGWNENLKYLWHDLGFKFNMAKAKLTMKKAAEPVIIHIGGAAAIVDPEALKQMYTDENDYANEVIHKSKQL